MQELGNLEEDYLSQQEVNSILTAVVQVQCSALAAWQSIVIEVVGSERAEQGQQSFRCTAAGCRKSKFCPSEIAIWHSARVLLPKLRSPTAALHS